MAEEGHVGVDLVGDHHHAVRRAQRGQATERRGVPRDARGVVGVGEQQQAASARGEQPLEPLEVHLITLRRLAQRVPHHLAVVGARQQVEGVIDGRLHDDSVARAGETVDDQTDALDDAGDVGEPLGPDLPAVAPPLPCDDRGAVALGLDRVAEDRVAEPAAQRLDHEVGRLEIHVGDPHRQQVLPAVVRAQSVELHGAAAAPLHGFVEVVVHGSLCFYMAGAGGRIRRHRDSELAVAARRSALQREEDEHLGGQHT